jgi:hypothetical protein
LFWFYMGFPVYFVCFVFVWFSHTFLFCSIFFVILFDFDFVRFFVVKSTFIFLIKELTVRAYRSSVFRFTI